MAVRDKGPLMKANPNFTAEVGQKFKPSDTIVVICRSGNRSAAAANAMASTGFKIADSVTDGFEGDRVKDPSGSFYGKRFENGWRQAFPGPISSTRSSSGFPVILESPFSNSFPLLGRLYSCRPESRERG